MNAFSLIGAYEVDDAGRQLAADWQTAIHRTIKQAYAASLIGAPEGKLSEQLNGLAPFTLLGRFGRLPVECWRAFHAIRAERHGDAYLTLPDLLTLIGRVDLLLSLLPKVMVKADLSRGGTVTLPLGRKKEQAS